jgi:zinc/manganese transport system substrate-binding protein
MLLIVAACAAPVPTGGRLLIVATTTIVADLVRGVAEPEASVEVLMPTGADPHDFTPSARQAASLRDAALVVTSGLGLEGGLEDAIDAAAADGTPILELGPVVDPRPLGRDASGTLDPHWWLDPVRGATAVRVIGERLAQLAPGGWAARADTRATELAELDAELRSILSVVPEQRRKLVTSHDAFGYFAARYGFTVLGVLIPGGATQAQPDPRALAALAALIRDEGVPAIFAETMLPTNVAEALAAEVGDEVSVVLLYTGSLGESGSGAETYAGMLRTNAVRIAAALG